MVAPDAGTQVRVVVGKGGVGKTTVAAALALSAARRGQRALVLELERRPELARCFDQQGLPDLDEALYYRDPSGGEVRARHVAPDAALTEWLADHGLRSLGRRLASNGALDVVATAVPGIRDVLILGKVKALANRAQHDVIYLDAPATGHSLSLLAAPSSLLAATRSGPIRRQAHEVDELLRDPERTTVTLVTLPTDLAVSEAIEAAYDLEDRAGVSLAEVVVNQFEGGEEGLRHPLSNEESVGLDLDLAESLERARRFSLARRDEEELQRARLLDALPLPQVVLPSLDAESIGLAGLFELSEALDRRRP